MDDKHQNQLEERHHERQERRRSDRIGPVIGALVLIWLGVVFLAAQNPERVRLPIEIHWGNFWLIFLGGLGALLILQGLLRAIAGYPYGIASSLIWGVILLLVGVIGIFPGTRLDQLWPLAIIALGLGLLLNTLLRR